MVQSGVPMDLSLIVIHGCGSVSAYDIGGSMTWIWSWNTRCMENPSLVLVSCIVSVECDGGVLPPEGFSSAWSAYAIVYNLDEALIAIAMLYSGVATDKIWDQQEKVAGGSWFSHSLATDAG